MLPRAKAQRPVASLSVGGWREKPPQKRQSAKQAGLANFLRVLLVKVWLEVVPKIGMPCNGLKNLNANMDSS